MLSGFDTPHSTRNSLNIVVLGESLTGKTSLIEEYCGIRDPSQGTEKTGCCDIHAKKLRTSNQLLSVMFYDFSGDQSLIESLDVFLRILLERHIEAQEQDLPIHGIFLMFDCTSSHSLNKLKSWLQWFFSKMHNAHNKIIKASSAAGIKHFDKSLYDLPVIVFANKIDMFKAETFFRAEFNSLPSDQKNALRGPIQSIERSLKNHLALESCDNLVFSTVESGHSKMSLILDRVILALQEKQLSSVVREEFSIVGNTLAKCLKGKNFNENEETSVSWLEKLKSLLTKKDPTLLPL